MNVIDAINKFKAEIPTENYGGDWSVDFDSDEILFEGEFVCGFEAFRYCVALLSCYGYEGWL